jgi:hypothetical protein
MVLNIDGRGFISKSLQLYLGLGILGALVLISGLLWHGIKYQQELELAHVKEEECKGGDLREIPDLQFSPNGNRLNAENLAALKPGDNVIIYGHDFSSIKRWPGAYFQQWVKQAGKDFSVDARVVTVQDGFIEAESSCFPGVVKVPFGNLFDLFVSSI